MARADLRLTPDEYEAFMSRCNSMVVAALDDNGDFASAIAIANWRDGALTLRFHPDDALSTLLADGRAMCCTADEAHTYYEIKGVTIHGSGRALAPGLIGVGITDVVSFDFGKIPDRMK